MNTREQAIEAATKAILDYWQLPISSGDPHVSGDARRALDAAVPVLLNDLADRIEAGRLSGNVFPEDVASNAATVAAARLVRAAAEGWGQ